MGFGWLWCSYMKFIIDTNVLVYMVKEKRDIFKQIFENYGEKSEIYILEEAEKELAILEKRKVVKTNVLKSILRKYNIGKTSFSLKKADSQLIEAAKNNYIIITNDRALQKEIKENGGRFLVFGKKGLMNIDEVL